MATIISRTSKDGKLSYLVRVRKKGAPPQTSTFARLSDAKKWAQITPTTTSVLDRLILPAYAASKGADHHQEAEDVTGTSNRRRGVLHPAV